MFCSKQKIEEHVFSITNITSTWHMCNIYHIYWLTEMN